MDIDIGLYKVFGFIYIFLRGLCFCDIIWFVSFNCLCRNFLVKLGNCFNF